MALENAGLPVALMEPVGIGLRCEGEPLDAIPCGLDTELVRRAIAGGRVGVVPGFYGRGPDGKIYLLGRGRLGPDRAPPRALAVGVAAGS